MAERFVAFTPELDELKAIKDAILGMSDALKPIVDAIGNFKKPMDALKPVAKEINKSKFSKSVKTLGSMFKNLQGASFKATALQALFDVLSPLLKLFEPFQVALNIVKALFQALVGEALQPLFTALQPVYDMFLSFMPMFQTLGSLLGQFLAAALQPFVVLLTSLAPIFNVVLELFTELFSIILPPFTAIMKTIAKLFEAFLPILLPIIRIALIPLQVAFQLLGALLKPLTPILNALNPLFEMLGKILKPLEPIITLIGNIIANIFLAGLRAVAFGIAALIDAVTLGVAGAVAWVNKNFPTIPSMHEGGKVLSEGVVNLRPGEIVKTPEQQALETALFKSMHDELIQLNQTQQQMLMEKIDRHAFPEE